MVEIFETKHEVIVKLKYNPDLIKIAKSIYPYKWDKVNKVWRYPKKLREEVYTAFGKPVPPSSEGYNFIIDRPLPSFLFKHQKECVRIATREKRFGYYLETGAGKTLVAATILYYLNDKSIIVAPLQTLRTVWEETFDKFYPEIDYINLYPLKKPDRERVIEKHDGVHIINYEGFKIHYETIKKAGYRCLVLDESSKLKGRTTQIAKKLIEFGQIVDCAYLLSGTPAPNGRFEFFPQVQILAPNLLGYSYHSFKNRYFYSPDPNGFILKEKREFIDEFTNRLKRVCIFIKKEECVDLPEKTFQVRSFPMSRQQRKLYEEMKRQFIVEVEDKVVVASTVLTRTMKLRQITSGFLYHSDGTVTFDCSKLNALCEVLEEIGDNQVIIWCSFREEMDKILEQLGDCARGIYGGMTYEEKEGVIKGFQNGEIKYLVAMMGTVSHGVTFINCSYAIYYSLDWSNELFQQSQDRIHRIGQKNRCTYFILSCENSIDEVIWKKLNQKIEDVEEIIKMIKEEGK